VDDQRCVRLLHGLADLAEKAQPRRDVQPVRRAVLVDAPPLDELHDEKRQPLGGRAAVEQPRDVGMLDLREDLPLAAEAPHERLVAERRGHDLDRDRLPVLVVGAVGQVDDAHAAAPEFPDDLVRAQPPACAPLGRVHERRGWTREEVAFPARLVRFEQRLDHAGAAPRPDRRRPGTPHGRPAAGRGRGRTARVPRGWGGRWRPWVRQYTPGRWPPRPCPTSSAPPATATAAAEDLLASAIYPELRRLARRYLSGERAGHTLQTTELVHEAWLRLFGAETITYQDRAHLMALMATQMRRVLVDHARRRNALKGPGAAIRVALGDDLPGTPAPDEDILAVDEALRALEAIDHRASRVVELRFFAGLGEEEAALALGVSLSTLKRDWAFARAWLFDRLASNPASSAA
jgi:RNA polymerase sigma-70 factor, ECF subfamily